ncbi:unnamed protein product [Rangifer tarandus platyrhynchus]|uniref:Uncharacterized protein n=2 Tax=Rangifer tarandus platyrhynchus TaxID=3082113 RepID=A0AC59ZVQ3_RANTA|nr:unnamed protein product [Rangifer tarandus platyrhynchus]
MPSLWFQGSPILSLLLEQPGCPPGTPPSSWYKHPTGCLSHLTIFSSSVPASIIKGEPKSPANLFTPHDCQAPALPPPLKLPVTPLCHPSGFYPCVPLPLHLTQNLGER